MGLNTKCFQTLLRRMCLAMGTISIYDLHGKICMALHCTMQNHEYQFMETHKDQSLCQHQLERQHSSLQGWLLVVTHYLA